MELARHVAKWSEDPITQVGCVVVGPGNEVRSIGYNGLPRRISKVPQRLERPEKYGWIEHAERNAIYAAARSGSPLEGCRLYVSWFTCLDCARAIIQVGIDEVVAIEPDWNHARWGPELVLARDLLEESKIRVRFLRDSE